MSEYNECPLGVNMHDFEHADRIQELSKAISRYACFFEGDYRAECYEMIAKWAEEIKLLSEMEIKLLLKEKDE
jgi:hypothetical protein